MKTNLLVLLFLAGICNSRAQIPISTVIYEYVPANSGQAYTSRGLSYKFGKQSGTTKNLQNIVALHYAEKTFVYNQLINGMVKLRRADNPEVNGNRCLVWMESKETGTNIMVSPPYLDSMELFLDGRSINRGTDNLFGNQGDGSGNNNNIERVDWIVAEGIKSNAVSESGFTIFERGADNQHDPFCIAAILSLDSEGNPSRYGPLVRITSSQFGNVVNSSLDYTILRKEFNEFMLNRTSSGTQKRGGVLVTLQKLGIAINQTIYGYSIFGSDMPASAAPEDLIDYTNTAFFPRHTSSNTGDGGIDLIAITGLFNTGSTIISLPVSFTEWQVTYRQNAVRLQWQINYPLQCSAISVEKAGPDQVWKTVAKLPFNSSQYTDTIQPGSRWHFRLKITEKDGQVHYSSVKTVAIDPITATTGLQFQQAGGTILAGFNDGYSQPAELQVATLNGALLLRINLQTKKGRNTVPLPLQGKPGIVIVSVYTANFKLQKKLAVN